LIRPNFMMAYFSRANLRYKLVDYTKNYADTNNVIDDKAKSQKAANDGQILLDINMIIDDLNKVNQLNPDFSFAYFNKANILCSQKDFKTAILNYTKALEVDGDFAEAYFNRGLTYLFTGVNEKGLVDLSKAGELGIFKAYNLIQRFKK